MYHLSEMNHLPLTRRVPVSLNTVFVAPVVICVVTLQTFQGLESVLAFNPKHVAHKPGCFKTHTGSLS